MSVRAFYARRAKRLLPTLAVVLLAVAVLAWLVFPPLRRTATYLDVIASALYVVNWWFASQAMDYAALGSSVSPVQHVWSLAVEEQFYLVWPVLVLGVTRRWRRRGELPRPVLLVALAAVCALSFLHCVRLTDAAPGTAYYSSLARGWELGVGGLLAVALPRGARVPGGTPRPCWAWPGWARSPSRCWPSTTRRRSRGRPPRCRCSGRQR